MSKMPGLRELAMRAKTWLATVKDQAGVAKLAKESEEKEARIRALEEQIKELTKLAVAPAGAVPPPTTSDSTGGIAKGKQ
jgi:hypothetical protein